MLSKMYLITMNHKNAKFNVTHIYISIIYIHMFNQKIYKQK